MSRLGVPTGAAVSAARAVETAIALPNVLRRGRVAKSVLKNSKYRGFIPKTDGCRMLAEGELPGSREIVALCRSLLEERRDHAREITRAEANPFDMLFSEEVLKRYPAFVEFATSPALVEIATDYFGRVPRLEYIDLWLSRPSATRSELYNSQLYHVDKIDQGILTLFLAVDEITADTGPFTFLPAGPSERVLNATDYSRNYLFRTGRIADEDVYRHVAPDEALAVEGPPASGAFCDTGRCLHFGSRGQTRDRVVFVLRYYDDHRSHPSVYRKFPKATATIHAEAVDLMLSGLTPKVVAA
jgi:hypothetical protein